jgi:putative transposase
VLTRLTTYLGLRAHYFVRRAASATRILREAAWRCLHFLHNCLDYLPHKAEDDCVQELRWLYARRNLAEAQHDLTAWLTRWQRKYPKLTDWVEENIGGTLMFYRLPRQHHKHLQNTNMLERLNGELRRRTRVVPIFPNAAGCLRLIRALSVEMHEGWLEDKRYINMVLLRRHARTSCERSHKPRPMTTLCTT